MNYKVFLNEVTSLDSSIRNLLINYQGNVDEYDVEFFNGFNSLFTGVEVLKTWATAKIDEGETPVENAELALMTEFLNRLRALFEEFNASLEIKSGSTYGTSYGGADVMEVRVSKGGVDAVALTPRISDTLLNSVDFDILAYEMVDNNPEEGEV